MSEEKTEVNIKQLFPQTSTQTKTAKYIPTKHFRLSLGTDTCTSYSLSYIKLCVAFKMTLMDRLWKPGDKDLFHLARPGLLSVCWDICFAINNWKKSVLFAGKSLCPIEDSLWEKMVMCAMTLHNSRGDSTNENTNCTTYCPLKVHVSCISIYRALCSQCWKDLSRPFLSIPKPPVL